MLVTHTTKKTKNKTKTDLTDRLFGKQQATKTTSQQSNKDYLTAIEIDRFLHGSNGSLILFAFLG